MYSALNITLLLPNSILTNVAHNGIVYIIRMQKKTRTILFYSSVIFFTLLSIVVVLYSLGYKYDFIDNKFVKTGSLRVATNLSNAEVYINSELKGKTSFITGNFSKGRFLPRIYNVRVEKEGYQTWEKNIDIERGLFSDFPVVVLLPDKFEITITASSSLSVPYFSFDKSLRRAYLEDGVSEDGLSAISVLALDNGQLVDVFEVPKKVLSENPIVADAKFYYLNDNNLMQFDPKKETYIILSETVKSFYVSQEHAYFTKFSDNTLYIVNTSSDQIKNLLNDLQNETDLIIKAEQVGNEYYLLLSFLNSSNKLFKFNENDLEPETIASNVLGFEVSPDRKKLSYFTRNELWTIWLNDTTSQPLRKAGEKELITRYSHEIKNVKWYRNSEHLIVQVGGGLVFVEIDGRGKKRNQYDITYFDGIFNYEGSSNNMWIFGGKELANFKLE